jgi:2-polyprenyl-3-methyl-5-hydroxy-6-metoxy-1,4-benzoquinol methylase
VAALGTIECLENPRAFVRELTRLAQPGGLILLTTSNQLSLLSKITLLLRNQFNAIRDGAHCPALITGLLEVDLRRIAAECGLTDIQIQYTDHGRIPFTSWPWPRRLGFRGRAFSDGVLLAARKPV